MSNAETSKIPILTYHSIDNSGSVISTAPDTFRRQMKFLSENGYSVVSLGNLVSMLRSKQPISPKTISLTFDDGFQNFYTTAFPVLKQYGFSATVFLITDFCDKYNDWAGNPPGLPRSKLMSWREIKELNQYGIEFGSHTRRHPDLTRICTPEATREITESKSVIEDALGEEVTTFAYPYGKFNSSVRKIAEETFAAACSTKLGKMRPYSDFFSLERVDTYYLSNPAIFDSLSTRSFDRYLFFRRVLRDVKSFVTRN